MPTSRRTFIAVAAAAAAGPMWALRAAHAATVEPNATGGLTAPHAPAVALPGLYDERIDPAPYLVSEKFDGVRGVWDGRTLRFRSGRPVPAPAWFTARLPSRALDGELWLGRGRFDALSGLVRSDPPDAAAWRQVRYMVFDLPGAPGRFDERAAALADLARRTGWHQFVAAEQTPAGDRAGLARRLARTVDVGGEGLVLHLASAPWTAGRSDVTLKYKPVQDAEATVVGYRPGHGKYAGQVGAVDVRAADGRRFSIGSGLSDAMRRAPPPPGTVITYRYRDTTPAGLPRFATYWRVRPDV